MADENQLDIQAAKQYAILLDVECGTGDDASVTGYAIWDSDIVIGSSLYVAEPRIKVNLPKIEGSAEETTFVITVPRIGDFARYGLGEAAPPMWINIDEVDPADPDTRRRIYRAMVQTASSNPAGRPNLIDLTMAGYKNILGNIALGLRCVENCVWAFGDRQCCLDLSDKTFAATVLAISGLQVELGFESGVSMDPPRWTNGVLSYRGLRIRIRGNSESVFTTSRQAPATWVGLTIAAINGCDKTLGVCRSTWNNEARFGGIGLAMPAYNPVMEDAP